ncbi:MAG: glycosyltransferase family 39 protein [Cyanobium sp.]
MRVRDLLQLRWWQPLVLAILAFQLGIGLRIPRIDHPDELWSLGAVQRSYGQLLTFVLGQDNHPPLYYLIIKAWSSIAGNNLASVRILSYLFALLTLFLFALFFRRSRPIVFVAPLLLLATNPLFTYYATMVRPYAFMVLLATLAVLSNLKLRAAIPDPLQATPLQSSRAILSLQAVFYGSCLALGLTHYYGWLYALILLAFEFFGRRISSSRLPSIIVGSLMFIWPLLQVCFGSLDRQIESNSWVRVVPMVSTLNNALMGLFPAVLASRQPPYLFSIALLLCLATILCTPKLVCRPWDGWSWIRSAFHHPAGYLAAGLGLVYLASLGADLRIPFSTPYYFLVALPAVGILFGFAADLMRQRFGSLPLAIFLVGVTSVQLILVHQRLLQT